MTVKTFVFRDICNSRTIGLLDERRRVERESELGGRRTTDGRHWFEGSVNRRLQEQLYRNLG